MTDSDTVVDTDMLGAIGDSLATVWREHTGKKPLSARTYIGEDLVICLLEGGMSPYEKRLINDGDRPAVWAMREHMRIAVENDEVAEVERLMGRRVLSFLSDHDTRRDLAAEFFVLEPLST
jgi:uncharacterized protein YbcI